MQPLHDQNDGIVRLVVEARRHSLLIPAQDPAPGAFGVGLLGLHRVVDDDQIAAAAGRRTADRGGETASTPRSYKFRFVILLRTDPGFGEDPAIPIRPHHRPAIIVELARQNIGIGGRDDLARRIVTEDEGREGDRDGDRFEVARGHQDGEALAFAVPDPIELMGDGLDVPVEPQLLARCDSFE